MTDFADLASRAPVHDPTTCTRRPCRRCDPHPAPVPPKPVDREVAEPPAPPDPTVRSIGLPKHPDPSTIADALEAAATALRKDGLAAITMASTLAARGYSAVTLGDGGSRSSDTTSSTERHGNQHHPWANLDHTYARLLRVAWQLASKLTAHTTSILAHATDIDPTPAGTGACRACNRVCRPDAQRPGNRLRSGLCPTCSRAWQRYMKADGSMLWSEWVAKRREGYTERDPQGRLVAVHTPEPDHDIDLTVDLPPAEGGDSP